jgi:hypothetical protein
LLFGQTNTAENGLWVFWVDDLIGAWRPYALRNEYFPTDESVPFYVTSHASGASPTDPVLATITGPGYTVVTAVGEKFVTYGVQNGDICRALYSGLNYREFIIDHVVSEQVFHLVSGPASGVFSPCRIEIYRPVPHSGCLHGTQWLFGWPGAVDGQMWWITDQLPELSASSSSPMTGTSLPLTSCAPGFYFREMTEWETRFLDIYDTPLLGTELGSIDTTSIPNDDAYHDVEINLTGLPAWLSSSDRTYLVMAIDADLIKLRVLPGVSNWREAKVWFEIESIIPQV